MAGSRARLEQTLLANAAMPVWMSHGSLAAAFSTGEVESSIPSATARNALYGKCFNDTLLFMARRPPFRVMTLIAFLAGCLILEGAALPQAVRKKKPPVVKPAPTVACPDPDARAACRSFAQLVDANDAALLASIKPTSYVCFRPKEDVFVVIHYRAPHPPWTKSENDRETQSGFVNFVEYRNGVVSTDRLATGTWSRIDPDRVGPMEPLFESGEADGSSTPVQIDIQAEINVSYDFQNTTNETIGRSLTIRRSTGRFVENFKPSADAPFEFSGTCLIYK